MHVVLVSLEVRPELMEEFLAGIHANALASLRDEPGCLRFDVHRSTEDPHRFVLYEIYHDQTAFTEEHRSAPHYAAWRDVAARCVVPGSHVNTFCTPAFPENVLEATRPEAHR